MKKTIVITGAGSGIGKDSVYALARRGHQVIATTETDEQCVNLKKEMQSSGLDVRVFKLDLLSEEDRAKIETVDFDVLINNAGTGESGSLAEIEINKIRSNFEVNVFCPLALSQLALKNMISKKRGTVLFVSSLAGKIAMPFLAPYCMSKAALSNGIEALRSEIRGIDNNVHVSLIEPGAYHTGFNQRNLAKKYSWMNSNSYFFRQIGLLKLKEDRQFRLIELKSTRSIVNKIVKAAEAARPRLRYSAPWPQTLGIYLLRLFGK